MTMYHYIYLHDKIFLKNAMLKPSIHGKRGNLCVGTHVAET